MTTSSNRLPTLFLAHGSPMNVISDNEFTRRLTRLGNELPEPKAILIISAHWMTRGLFITAMERPRTIHDFRGFPQALYQIQYPAPGAPHLARDIQIQLQGLNVTLDESEWGLDHGSWSILRFIFPNAQIPVLQLSLDMSRSPEEHFSIGEQLRPLRSEGVLILASGNIVHNLQKIDWKEDAPPPHWAIDFDQWIKDQVLARRWQALVTEPLTKENGRLSIPTPDHYLPMLYVLGASDDNDSITSIFEGFQNSSISMRSIQLG